MDSRLSSSEIIFMIRVVEANPGTKPAVRPKRERLVGL